MTALVQLVLVTTCAWVWAFPIRRFIVAEVRHARR